MKRLILILLLLVLLIPKIVFADPVQGINGISFYDRTSRTWMHWPSADVTGQGYEPERVPAMGVFLFDQSQSNYDPLMGITSSTLTYTTRSTDLLMLNASLNYARNATGDWITLRSNTSGILGTVHCDSASICNNLETINGNTISATGRLGTPTMSSNYNFYGTATWLPNVSHYDQTTASVTTNAAGTAVDMTNTPPARYTMIVDRTAGATNTVEIDLQCSVDATTYVQIATITDLTNEPVLTAIGDVPCKWMRYNVVTIGAGNTVTINLLATR